jgi:hypothetical protein
MPEERPSRIQIILPHLSRWRSLRQFLPTVLWFVAGAVLQGFEAVVLFPLWLEHGVKPIFRWADSFRLSWNTAMGHLMISYVIYLSAWLTAILAGIIGGLIIKRHVLRDLCSLAFGFALTPLLIETYNSFAFPSSDYITESGFLVLLTLCFGMMTHHVKIRSSEKSSPTTS